MKQIAKLKDEARKYEQKEEWDKAIQAYTEVLRLGEAGDGADLDLPLYNRVGDLYVRLGQPHDAVTFYERAADKYAEVGLHNNAIALCNKALRYDANRVELLKKLGHFSASQGFYTDARRWYLEYCDKMSKRGAIDEAFAALIELADVNDAPEIRELLGRQLREHGRDQQAVIEFQRAYALRVAAGQTREAAAIRAEIQAIDPQAGLEAPAPRIKPPVSAPQQDEPEGLPGFMNLEDLPPPAAEVDRGRAVAPTMHAPPATPVLDGVTEEAAPPPAIETFDTAKAELELDTPSTADFGTIEFDAGLDLGSVPSPSDIERFDIGLEHAHEFEPLSSEPEEETTVADELPTLEPEPVFETEPTFEQEPAGLAEQQFAADASTAESAVDEFGLFDLNKIDFGGGFGLSQEAPAAMPELEQELTADLGADLPVLEEVEDEAGEPLPLVGIDDGSEFGEEGTDGEPQPLAFDHEPAPVDDAFTDIDEEDEQVVAAPEPIKTPARPPTRPMFDFEFDEPPQPEVAEPEPEFDDSFLPEVEPEPEIEPAVEPEPEPEPELEPMAAAPPPPPPPPPRPSPPPPSPAPAPAAPPARAPTRSREYVDLAAFLGAEPEESAAESTRFVVAEKPPSGDEERDFAEMLQQFKAKVAETIPKEDAGSHYDLGLAFKDMGLIDEAIAEFQIALRGGEHKLKVFEELGNCFVQKQQYSVAITILNRAMEVPSTDETELLGVYYNLGLAHEALGQRGEAKAAFERVISVDIGFQDTNERLAKL